MDTSKKERCMATLEWLCKMVAVVMENFQMVKKLEFGSEFINKMLMIYVWFSYLSCFLIIIVNLDILFIL